MYRPDFETFCKHAKRGNLIPVWRELLADLDTPVSAYTRLRTALQRSGGNACTFLLESVEGGEHIGRYSFIGGAPRAVFEARGTDARVTEGERVKEWRDCDPLAALREYMERFRPVADPELPRFFGGAVGYMGYDTVARFERIPLAQGAGPEWPDMFFAVTDTLVIFDRVRHTIRVVANALVEGDERAAYDAALKRIEDVCSQLATPVRHSLAEAALPAGDEVEEDVRANMSPAEFMAAVEKAREYIRAGDIIQVVLSQRFETAGVRDPLNVYRALRSINPSPYMFCLEMGEKSLVGSSPEVHVRCEGGRVEIRPIAGTRPRGADGEKDRALEKELLADPKERAEHIMLVDLARNDVGRVSRYGTVRVPELMVIEKYSHVMHIVSDVVGRLSPERDAYDVMRATFPAGTVSGAPKIRAMEIIAELEPDRRGPYAGAVGYFSFNGNLDSCITIRTVLLDGKRCMVQAGAGIVADSDPRREYEETRNKARGALKAVALARRWEGK